MATTLYKVDDDLIISARSITFKTHPANSGLAEPADTSQLSLTDALFSPTQPVGAPNGTASLPGITFAADPDTGLTRSGANQMDIIMGGTVVARGTTTSIQMQASTFLLVDDGAVGTPGLAFRSDGDCGFYRIGANNWAAAVGGAKVVEYKAAGVQVTGNVEHGAVSAFASTAPVSAATFKTGTAPAGAAATSGGIFTDGTTMKKIIADGTVSDIQT